MSSGADKNGKPSMVMAAIAELKLELSKQIRESFSSLEARVIALEERSSNVDERIKKLEDQTGYAGILGSFQPQHTTMSIREASSSEAKLEPWNIAVTETVPSVPLPVGSFPKASTVPSFGTTPFAKSMPTGTIPPLRVAAPHISAAVPHIADTAGIPRYHKLDFPTYDGKEDPLRWNIVYDGPRCHMGHSLYAKEEAIAGYCAWEFRSGGFGKY